MKMEDTKTKVIEGTVFDSKFNAHSRRICLYEHPSLDPISRKATLVIGERGIPESAVRELAEQLEEARSLLYTLTALKNCRKRVERDGSLNHGPTCLSPVKAEYTPPDQYCDICASRAFLSRTSPTDPTPPEK